MSDPTPFPTDPLEPEGTDPDLSKDDDERLTTEDAVPDGEEHPDDRPPTYDERRRDRAAAEHDAHAEPDAGIA